MPLNKLHKLINISLLIGVGLSLSGCDTMVGEAGYVHNRSNAYMVSENGKRLKMPDSVQAQSLSDYYLIPDESRELKFLPAYTPPGSLASKQVNQNAIVKQPALGRQQVQIVNESHVPVLTLSQDFNHAWLSIASAFARQGVPIIEADRKGRIYKIADTFPQEAGISKTIPIYRVQLTATHEKKVQLRLLPLKDGHQVNQHVSKRLLAQIQKGLIGKYKSKGLMDYLNKIV